MAVSKRAWLHPDADERAYSRELVAYADAYHAETAKRLQSLDMKLDGMAHEDGFSEDLTAIIAGLMIFAQGIATPLIARLPDRFMSVSSFNDRQWVLQVKAGTGLDLNRPDLVAIRSKFGLGVDVWRSEPWLVPLRDNWVASNVALIRDMPQKYLTQVDSVVRSGVAQGLGVRGIASQLESIGGIDKRRAKLIASDQVGKANAALTQYRQMDLGLDSYVWRSSNDSRVRPTHAEAEGQTFKWAKPPTFTGGHPGHAVRCRCRAAPVFPD
jgi:SPP1 gp7 family putative phage head morphogenesis protein